ncbi:MAG: hypothetical protein VKO21_00085 [Candidatus Sericytochromatia bacterium]|nr:hypothetical protein [Candidatus Sericytochromatia bacterium]
MGRSQASSCPSKTPRVWTWSIEGTVLASRHPYLIPGDVLTKDLLAPDTGTVLVPAGTVLNHEAIIRIRAAGLERSTLRLVTAARQALASGMNLRAFGGQPASLASTLVQVKAKRIMATTAGLRALLLLMVIMGFVLAFLTNHAPLTMLSFVSFAVLSIVTLSTGSTAQTYTRHLKELRAIERASRIKQQNLERRAQEGEVAAIKELLAGQTLGDEHVLGLEAGKGWVVAHVLLPDARLLLSPAGLGFNVPAASVNPPVQELDPIPEVVTPETADEVPTGTEEAQAPLADTQTEEMTNASTSDVAEGARVGELLPEGGHTLRLASGAAIEALYNHAAQQIQAVMSASPMTRHLALSFHDACVRPARPRQPYWGCVANFRITREQFLDGQRENELSLFLTRARNVHIRYERDRPLLEVRPIPLTRPTDVPLEADEAVTPPPSTEQDAPEPRDYWT